MRPSNRELCDEFRALLTTRAADVLDDATLAATREYRNELWRNFGRIRRRLCPLDFPNDVRDTRV